jgi:hypothetical protein
MPLVISVMIPASVRNRLITTASGRQARRSGREGCDFMTCRDEAKDSKEWCWSHAVTGNVCLAKICFSSYHELHDH